MAVEGASLSDRHLAALGSIEVRLRASMPSLCELTFLDPGEDLSLGERLRPGAHLVLSIGGAREALFDGEVTALEHFHESDRGLTVRTRGYDRLHRLRKRNPARTFERMAVSDIASRLVADLGMTVDTDDQGPVSPMTQQYGQSDLALLRQVTEPTGFYFTANGDKLVLFTLSGRGQPIEVNLGSTLWEARTELNADRVVSAVQATGWDPRVFEVRRGAAKSPRSGRDVKASVAASDVGGDEQRLMFGLVAATDDEVEGRARDDLDRSVISSVVLEGVIEGDGRVRPGSRLDVSGLGQEYSGHYVVTEATHRVGEAGYLTEFSTAAPQLSEVSIPEFASLTAGVVIDVDDPDRLGRVRVELPAFDTLATEWMAVALPGAANDKGLIVLPDVGDDVVVAFPGRDFARGVVLGSVFGSSRPRDSGVEAGSVRRYRLMTRGGHKFLFDDSAQLVRLEDTTGNSVEMHPAGMRVKAQGDLEIMAPGRAITITADTVDFVRG